jgi:nicotinamide mononucleotide transporter
VEYLTVDYWAQNWLEATGLISGLLCVLLLIRQNIWNWPIGLLYSLVSIVVFLQARLYADLALHVFYVAMNAYGWYYWTFAERPVEPSGESSDVPVTNTPLRAVVGLSGLVVATTAALGWFLANHTDAAVPYWDSATTTMSFAAMWLQARKHIENWVVWLVVDIVATGIYLFKGLEMYALLYCVYIGMAFAGWWAWRQSMLRTAPV